MKNTLTIALILLVSCQISLTGAHATDPSRRDLPQDTAQKEKKGFFRSIFGTKKKSQDEQKTKADQQKRLQEIEKQKGEIQLENDLLNQRLNTVDYELKILDQKVAKQAKDIENMTLAQAKSELLLARQKSQYDSLNYIRTLDSLQIKEQKLVLSEKEAQLANEIAQADLQKSQFNLLIALAGIVLLVAGGLYYRMSAARKVSKLLGSKNKLIEEEKKRSEALLLNILPQNVAEELKKHGASEPQHFDEVCVMFADFTGFTAIAEQLSPKQLVEELDYCFKGFDEIVIKHGLEKIKTIGDAYMVASGLSHLDPDHPRRMVAAAIEMQEFLFNRYAQRAASHLPAFQARIGIHTGEIVAGVVGSLKFAYDIWGDTVNVAARMESNSLPGRVNVSSQTYEHVKNFFEFESRGKINAKNKGEIEMFFVVNPKR